ncbi:glycosyl hydrolase family 20, catalytic domain-containing protein [Phthorimaea operculella]|nr:glycosyl hydrolase family 20, catalytic domain-containing protein [Phthorimaea operculella]
MWLKPGQYILTMLLILQIPKIGSTGSKFDEKKQLTPPLWTWQCVNQRCLQSHVTSLLKIQSLETCNMLCASMQLWPQPTGAVKLSTTAVPVKQNLFELRIITVPSKAVYKHLKGAFQLFLNDLQNLEKNARGLAEWRLVVVQVIVNGSGDPRMRLDTDESYSLSVQPTQSQVPMTLVVRISASSFCGARHGLETLQQLIWFDSISGSLHMLEAAHIEDSPQFSYRGLLLDTARNFFPVQDLFRTIDAMAASKLNTFHWHITDSQSFPLKLASVPQLAVFGAYGTGAIYTTEDVRRVVQRAKLRGIRVLIEVNTPAHVGAAWAWGSSLGFGDLIQCYDPDSWHLYCSEPPCGQLNPRNHHVYNILEAIYSEIFHLTGVDDIFHLGGDDYSPECYMELYPKEDPASLLLEFTRNSLKKLESVHGVLPNLTLLWWSSLSENLKIDLREFVANLGLQIRKPVLAEGGNQYEGGIRTILSHADMWDLNSGMGEWHEGKGVPYNSWQQMYEYRPWTRSDSAVSIIGAEVTAWSSTLNVGGLDARLWPRAAAFAERVWSDRPESATRTTHIRMDIHRNRLVARGIRATPIWSLWCSQNPHTCG